jgi:hypothetical protein
MDTRCLLFVQGPTNTLSSVRSNFESITGDRAVCLRQRILDKQNHKPLAVPEAASSASSLVPSPPLVVPSPPVQLPSSPDLTTLPGCVYLPTLHQTATNGVQPRQEELSPEVSWSFSNAPNLLREFRCH